MNITGIRLRAGNRVWENNNILYFPIHDASLNDPYIITDSAGLDPPDNILKKRMNYFEDIYEILPEKREVVLRIGLNPNSNVGMSYSDLRDSVYKFISSNVLGAVTLELLNNDDLVAYSVGSITKIEATHFVNNPELQITLEFENAKFRSPNVIVLEDLSSTFEVDYGGTAPTGMEMTLQFSSSEDTATFRHVTGEPPWWFSVPYEFEDGDWVEMITHHNEHLFLHFRPTMGPPTITDLTGFISNEAHWFQLYPGINKIQILNDHFVVSQFSYYEEYWGV